MSGFCSDSHIYSIQNNSSIVSGVIFLKGKAFQGLRRCNLACLCVILVVSGGKNLD